MLYYKAIPSATGIICRLNKLNSVEAALYWPIFVASLCQNEWQSFNKPMKTFRNPFDVLGCCWLT